MISWRTKLTVLSVAFFLVLGSQIRLKLMRAQAGVSEAQAQRAIPTIWTYRGDNIRSGVNASETILTPDNVNQNSFGLLFTDAVSGAVFAQPLYVPSLTVNGAVHNVVFVVTEADNIYAFDADKAGKALWGHSLLGKGEQTLFSADTQCGDVAQYGITSTPVIDQATGTIYVVTRSKLVGTTTQYFARLHALPLTGPANGERAHFPVTISASVSGTGDGSVNGVVSFDPLRGGQRAALLETQKGKKEIYVAFASDCDNGPYHGWVLAYDPTTGRQTGVFNDTPNGSDGGIWESGNGPAEDSSGNIFMSIANGTYDPEDGSYGDSIARLIPVGGASRAMTVADYFTPSYQCFLQDNDLDMGSFGTILLPTQDTGTPDLLVGGDKYGTLYLLNRDDLGGGPAPVDCPSTEPYPQPRSGPPECNDALTLPECFIAGSANKNQLFASPVYWNGKLYVVPNAANPEAFSFANGLLSSSPVDQVPTAVSFSQTSHGIGPVISSSGTNNGILWIVDDALYAFSKSGQELLYAFDATNLKSLLYANNQNATRDNPGGSVKFAEPVVVNGKVYIGTQTTLAVYGLLNQ